MIKSNIITISGSISRANNRFKGSRAISLQFVTKPCISFDLDFHDRILFAVNLRFRLHELINMLKMNTKIAVIVSNPRFISDFPEVKSRQLNHRVTSAIYHTCHECKFNVEEYASFT